jgi:hypothetical protein
MFTYYICEHPETVLIILAVVAVLSLIAARFTQLGKYAIAALLALVLAGVVVVCDWYWVTDRERIESVVYELADAVEKSEPDRIYPHIDMVKPPQSGFAAFDFLNRTLLEPIFKQMVSQALKSYKFDFVQVRNLRVEVKEQSRQGVAEFLVLAMAGADAPGASARTGAGTYNSGWTLRFRETEPGVWKVTRIDTGSDQADEVLRFLGMGQ